MFRQFQKTGNELLLLFLLFLTLTPQPQNPNTHLSLGAGAKQTLQMKISTGKTGLGPSSIQISKYPTQWSDSSPGLVTQAWLRAEKTNINISIHKGAGKSGKAGDLGKGPCRGPGGQREEVSLVGILEVESIPHPNNRKGHKTTHLQRATSPGSDLDPGRDLRG